MRPILPARRGKRKEISLYRQRVAVGDPGKARVRKHWEVVRSVGTDTLAQCAQELRVGPAADAGLRIGRDVRAVEGPEWSGERSTSGQLLPAGSGVAREAATRPHQVFAALDGLLLAYCRGRLR